MRTPSAFLRLLALTASWLAACGGESREREPEPNPGAPCTSPDECVELSCIADARFPGGYCSAVCEDGICVDGSRCIEGFGGRLCLTECREDADCRDGYQCWRGVCQPACGGDRDCRTPGARSVDGRCTGAECVTDTDCGSALRCAGGRCLDAGDGGNELRPDGSSCTLPAQCESGICLPPAQGGVCAPGCTDRDSCADFERTCAPVAMDVDGDGTGGTVVSACVRANPSGQFLAGFCRSDTEPARRRAIPAHPSAGRIPSPTRHGATEAT